MSFGQGGPYGPGGSGPSSTPDWAALAEQSEARGRRKRWLLIGGGALATVAVAGVVATAVITSDGGGKPSALPSPQDLPDEPDDPKPSFSDFKVPPPPDPMDYVTDPKKDTAPLTAASLFPDKQLTAGGRSYPRATTSATETCGNAAQGELVGVLKSNGCEKLLRATFYQDGVAVTVGVARFDSKAAAAAVKKVHKPNLAALAGGKVAPFCQATACRTSTNAIGRYAYFTISGYLNGKAVTKDEAPALQAGRDGASYAFERIMARGNAQATAAAKKQQQ